MPEPRGKLDTSVNGPEGPSSVFDGDAWDQVDWRGHEEQVRRLRGRIFKAAAGRGPGHGQEPAEADAAVLVQHAGQRAAGDAAQHGPHDRGSRRAGRTDQPGPGRGGGAGARHTARGSPSPVRRVYIPKASDKTKMRPLGIPVIMDRCHQARVRQALEPEWEARFEPRSYGFRPGRGCHDAIGSLFNTLRGKSKRVWILDADLAGAFDKIDHDHLLECDRRVSPRGT